MTKSIQETYAPKMACFGCGPANEKGLHIRSFPEGEEVVATFDPETYQEAFPGMLSGGIIGTLLDCHCNWTAAYSLMKQTGSETPPCTVTADYTIKLLRPTPTDKPVELKSIGLDTVLWVPFVTAGFAGSAHFELTPTTLVVGPDNRVLWSRIGVLQSGDELRALAAVAASGPFNGPSVGQSRFRTDLPSVADGRAH